MPLDSWAHTTSIWALALNPKKKKKKNYICAIPTSHLDNPITGVPGWINLASAASTAETGSLRWDSCDRSVWKVISKYGLPNPMLVGSVPTPLKNMKVSWEGLSHIWNGEKKNVWNHHFRHGLEGVCSLKELRNFRLCGYPVISSTHPWVFLKLGLYPNTQKSLRK